MTKADPQNLHFDPINRAHAIAELVLFFEFSPDLREVLPSLHSLKDVLKEKLPNVEIPQLFQVEFSPKQQSFRQVPGLELSRSLPDGTPAWIVNIAAPSVAIHCLDYTRWAAVWGEMRGYVGNVFNAIGAAPVSVSSIGLKYVDRFIWRGPEPDYDGALLFRTESGRLHPRAFKSGSRWHCHTGWFEQGATGEDILNQLNIDSGRHILDGAQVIIVSIDHTQILRATKPNQLAAYGSGSSQELEKLVQHFHADNKNVLASLLTKTMNTRINLVAEPETDVQ